MINFYWQSCQIVINFYFNERQSRTRLNLTSCKIILWEILNRRTTAFFLFLASENGARCCVSEVTRQRSVGRRACWSNDTALLNQPAWERTHRILAGPPRAQRTSHLFRVNSCQEGSYLRARRANRFLDVLLRASLSSRRSKLGESRKVTWLNLPECTNQQPQRKETVKPNLNQRGRSSLPYPSKSRNLAARSYFIQITSGVARCVIETNLHRFITVDYAASVVIISEGGWYQMRSTRIKYSRC